MTESSSTASHDSKVTLFCKSTWKKTKKSCSILSSHLNKGLRKAQSVSLAKRRITQLVLSCSMLFFFLLHMTLFGILGLFGYLRHLSCPPFAGIGGKLTIVAMDVLQVVFVIPAIIAGSKIANFFPEYYQALAQKQAAKQQAEQEAMLKGKPPKSETQKQKEKRLLSAWKNPRSLSWMWSAFAFEMNATLLVFWFLVLGVFYWAYLVYFFLNFSLMTVCMWSYWGCLEVRAVELKGKTAEELKQFESSLNSPLKQKSQ